MEWWSRDQHPVVPVNWFERNGLPEYFASFKESPLSPSNPVDFSSPTECGRAAAMVAMSETFELGGRHVQVVEADDLELAQDLPFIHEPDDEVYKI